MLSAMPALRVAVTNHRCAGEGQEGQAVASALPQQGHDLEEGSSPLGLSPHLQGEGWIIAAESTCSLRGRQGLG